MEIGRIARCGGVRYGMEMSPNTCEKMRLISQRRKNDCSHTRVARASSGSVESYLVLFCFIPNHVSFRVPSMVIR